MTITKRLTRGQAIKQYCKQSCCAGDMTSWKECSNQSCFLYPFRFGREIIEPQDKKTNHTPKQAVGYRNSSKNVIVVQDRADKQQVLQVVEK